MTDRALSPYSLTVADGRPAVRRSSWLQLCVPALVCAALLCPTLPATAQSTAPKLTVSDSIGNAELGFSVAVSTDGNTAIVGGPFDNSGAGAAWVFTRSGGTWTEQQKLTASDAAGAAQLGWSVALSADGNTAVVGGPGDNDSIGAAWVFTRSGSVWSQQGAKFSGAGATGAGCAQSGVVGNAEQGYAVALSADGSTALVGGWADNNALGAAWVFTQSGGVWGQPVKLCGSGATDTTNIMQGFSVALSDDGSTAIVGAPNNGDNPAIGAAWVFTQSGGQWSQQGKLIGGTDADSTSQQGFAVALSGDGNTAIVGGPGEETLPSGSAVHISNGAAWVFARSGGQWTQEGAKLVGTPTTTNNSPGQGFSVALADSGNFALVGGPTDNANTGATWVFASIGGTWTQQGNKVVFTGAVGAASQAASLALSRDGSTALVGGPLDQGGVGAIWAFANPGQSALAVSVTGGGSVTSGPSGISCPSTCSAGFGDGTSVGLTATPASGWVFSSWGGACSGSGACTVTVNGAQSVTATFTPLFALTVSANGSGSVTSTPSGISCPSTCSNTFVSGTQVTLTATPAAGYGFAGWSGACSGLGGCAVTMSAAESVTATFVVPGEALIVSVSGSGTVTSSPSGISCPSDCTMNFPSGTPVTLTATPGGGATFTGWSGACSGNGTCMVTVNSLASVTAMFSSPGGSSPASRTWVSAALGSDSNPCSRSAPCLTFAAALALTQSGGEIDVLDPGDYGPVTITQSVSIEGNDADASGVTSSGSSGVVVNAGAGDAVSLRGLTFNGDATPGASGIQFNSGARLIVQNCVIQSFGSAGIVFSPGSGSAATAQMDVSNTTITKNGGGVVVKPTGGIKASTVFTSDKIASNIGGGLKADGSGGTGMIDVTLTNGNVSFNGSVGINAVSSQGSVAITIVRVTVASNGVVGIQSNQANGGTATVTVGQSTISGNAVGVSAVGGGSLLSDGNNKLTGNTTNGNFTGNANVQ